MKLLALPLLAALAAAGGCACGHHPSQMRVTPAAMGFSIEPAAAANDADASTGPTTRVYDVSRLIPTTVEEERAENARVELATTIQEGVGEISDWIDSIHTINFAGTRMVVKTTEADHARIASLLSALGSMDAYPPEPEPGIDGAIF